MGVFRPVVADLADDHITRTLVALPAVSAQSYEEAVGVDYAAITANPDEAMSTIVDRFGAIADRFDAIVIVGSDYSGAHSPTEMKMNAQIAANLGAPVLLVLNGSQNVPGQIADTVRLAITEFEAQHIELIGAVATRVALEEVDGVKASLAEFDGLVTGVLPEDPVVFAPTISAQFDALDATLWLGNPDMLRRESLGLLIAGMTLPNLLDRLITDHTLIVSSDRTDLLPGLILAHQAGTFPSLAAIFLVGGYPLPEPIDRLMRGLAQDLPVGLVPSGTYGATARLTGLEGLELSSPRKIEVARRLYGENIDEESLLSALDVPRKPIRTPLMFQYQLIKAASSDRRRIVLPEAGDPRILQAASVVLHRGVADVILLGREDEVKRQAFDLGIDLQGAVIVDPARPEVIEPFAEEYARLRSHKGMTLDQARERMTDLSYVGTMMVHLGMADGMVSGAVHTTANTIRPSLEFIKTRPGVKVVSSSMLMCMPDTVLVFGDCAVNPDPTAEQLADIAISSADTAAAFDIDPRIAMLSYSTGSSGSGADVDKVREATDLFRERDPQAKVDGPIQFDAAIDPVVGHQKMPDSDVAGHATVFVFPDLNTGNNTYKAVQRTAGAVAIGPVLQGLNKPVNDLSRGALVDDIVYTVAITAIQAQALPAAEVPLPGPVDIASRQF